MNYKIYLTFMLLVGCAQGNCRSQKLDSVGTGSGKEMPTTSTAAERIRVYKYDGSKQCGQGKVVSPDEMKKQLGEIKTYSQMNITDNLMRTQVCGSDTGRANVYEIEKASLADAKKKGFREWTFD